MSRSPNASILSGPCVAARRELGRLLRVRSRLSAVWMSRMERERQGIVNSRMSLLPARDLLRLGRGEATPRSMQHACRRADEPESVDVRVARLGTRLLENGVGDRREEGRDADRFGEESVAARAQAPARSADAGSSSASSASMSGSPSTAGAGSENPNRRPSPGRLSTSIAPPIRSTSRCEMVRPSPVPPKRRVVDVSA